MHQTNLDGPCVVCMLRVWHAWYVFFKTNEAYEHGKVTLFKLWTCSWTYNNIPTYQSSTIYTCSSTKQFLLWHTIGQTLLFTLDTQLLFAPVMEIMMHLTSNLKYTLLSSQSMSFTVITDDFYLLENFVHLWHTTTFTCCKVLWCTHKMKQGANIDSCS